MRGWKTLKNIVEEVNYDGIEDIQKLFEEEEVDDEPKLIEDGDRVKTWRFKKSFNSPLTQAVMAIITLHVDMRVVVDYSFSCDIYQGDGGVTEYHKSKSTKESLSSLACEMQWLDIEDGEFLGKAYLPQKQTIETPGAFEGKLIFNHVQIKIISTTEPLLGCSPLPDWLRKKRCIYALDGTKEKVDNLCMWRCLAVHFRGDKKMREKFGTREALNLAREYYENPELKRELCVQQNYWILKEYRRSLTSTSEFSNHVLTQSWECEVCRQLFMRGENLTRHKENEC